MAMLLINADATVTVCHSKTADLKEECLRNIRAFILDVFKINITAQLTVFIAVHSHVYYEKILKLIPTEKDVDGFSEENTGKLSRGEDCLVACTPNGIMKILEQDLYLSSSRF